MDRSKNHIAVFCIVLMGIILHLAGISRPFLGNFAQHQTDYATVVRVFLERGINPALPLMKFIGAAKERIFLGDLPLTVTLTALLCKFAGLSIETCSRSLSTLFFLLSLYPFYRLARMFTADKAAAFWALTVYIFSPLTIVYGQSFLLEMPALFFLVSSLYLLFLWRGREKGAFLLLSAASAAFAISLRIYYSFFLVGAAYLFLSRYGSGIFKMARVYLYFLISISLVCAWQFYSHLLARQYGMMTSLEDNLAVFNVSRNFPDPVLLRFETYKVWIDNIVNKLTTPLGMVMALIGIFTIRPRRIRVLSIVFIAGFALLFIVIPRKMYEFDYYYLPLVPVVSILAGAGFENIIKNIIGTKLFKFCAASLLIALSLRYAAAPAFITPREDRPVLKAAEYVRNIVPETSRIIASHGTSTSFLYYCDRVGWAFQTDDSISTAVRFPGDSAGTAIDRLERFRSQGAEFFAITDRSGLEANRRLYDYMAGRYKIALEKGGTLIFDLRGAGR